MGRGHAGAGPATEALGIENHSGACYHSLKVETTRTAGTLFTTKDTKARTHEGTKNIENTSSWLRHLVRPFAVPRDVGGMRDYQRSGGLHSCCHIHGADVNESARGRFLHVANGTCTTNVIEAAGIPGMRSIWADPLYEGPVPAGLSDADLLDVRRRFLASDADSDVDPMNDMRRWRQVIEDHERYDELVLWFEHDLFDQLNLIQLLSWMRTRVPAAKPVSLVCIGSFPGRAGFKGLGELSPEELAPLFKTRHRVRDAEYTVAERAWRLFREPTPEPLNDLRREDTTALPYLAPALERLLQEYPSTADGLSRTERRLLRLADAHPIDLRAAFPRMHDDEDAYYVTDGSLADLAATLSRTSPPLVTIDDDPSADGFLRGAVSLTDAGREVLSGRRDRVACGLDRWVGGVHLQSGVAMWRWDDRQRRVIRS